MLVYLDLGMDPLSFLLAFSRLAPVQCVTGGHPVTSGIDTIDYYLSAQQTEPEGSAQHYSEKLHLLPSGGFGFERPALPSRQKSRAELGLPTAGNIYLCPMMLQKLHPDFDSALSRILELDPNGYVILFESFQHPRWGELLRARLDKNVSPLVRERIIFMNWVHDRDDFLNMIRASDIILDPFHFGIGTTGALTFAVGTPLVTMPGEFMRGRVGLLYCELLDTMECVTSSPEEYAHKAVEIVTNLDVRAAIVAKLLNNNHLLFNNHEAAARDYEDFIRTVFTPATSLT
jgi:predicted O-linked N-acetylglucosamine transferase (SPINDLY family)